MTAGSREAGGDAPFAVALDRARAGDRSALARIIEGAHGQLAEAARAVLGTPLRAKVRTSDLVQSALLEGLRSLEDFRGTSEAEFAGWLYRILENNLRDRDRYFRATRRDRGRETPLSELHTLAASQTPSPADEAIAAEFLLRVSEALSRLPAEYQRSLLLCLTRDVSHEEAGRILGKSAGASRVLLARARARLLAELERQDGERSGP